MNNDQNISIPEWKSVQGTYEVRMTTNGQGNYFLSVPGDGISLYGLASGKFNIEGLESLDSDNVVQVTGMVNYGIEPPVITVDEFTVLKTGHEVHFPPLDFSGEDMAAWFALPEGGDMAEAADSCPASAKAEIKKHVDQIKKSAEKLKSIDWKKYATIGGMVVGLLTSTVTAAMAAIPVAGPALAGSLLIGKVVALAKAISQLKNLDAWAQTESQLMVSAKDNLEKLKSKYPACFK